jgi:hypothetical protein
MACSSCRKATSPLRSGRHQLRILRAEARNHGSKSRVVARIVKYDLIESIAVGVSGVLPV